MKRRITILCDHDATKKPRSNRLLQMLDSSDLFILSVIHKTQDSHTNKNINFFSFPLDKTSKQRTPSENERILNHCKNNNFNPLIFTPNRASIKKILDSLPLQDLLILEDITLLPFATEYKKINKSCKILIDLREFYPLEYDNDKNWLNGLGKLFAHLCDKYLPQVDFALSVSSSFVEKYKKNYGIKCELFYSMPPMANLAPKPTNPQDIKIIYHGFISKDRSSENLLHLARNLPPNFKLFAMVLSNIKGYLEGFVNEAKNLKALQILPPVSLESIVPFCNQFDIGLIPFAPSTFNLTHCMPNKFFEYMQSRLMILSTPLQDIKAFLSQYPFGECSSAYSVDSMLDSLKKLDSTKIDTYKLNAHKLSSQFNTTSNAKKIIEIINNL